MEKENGDGPGRVRLLLIGIGGYGENYIREYWEKKPERVDLVGVCDPMAAKSPWYGLLREKGIPLFDSPEDFFPSERADLAVISSPIHTHGPYTILCLGQGCSVLCEKPLCSRYEEGLLIEREERKSGRFVAVGYQLNYSRDVLAVKRDILGGRFGKPLSAKSLHMMRRGMNYYGRNGWAGRISLNGHSINDSPVSNACAHQLHLLLFLLGPDFASSAGIGDMEAELYRANPHIENYDCAALRIRTVGGPEILYYTAHALEEERIGPVTEIRFEKAVLRFGGPGGNDFTAQFQDGKRRHYGEMDKGERMQKFYDSLEAVRRGTSPVCTAATALPHVECVERLARMPVVNLERDVYGWSEGGDEFFGVRRIGEHFQNCFDLEKLPGETGISFA